jgi:hypothetical protein
MTVFRVGIDQVKEQVYSMTVFRVGIDQVKE